MRINPLSPMARSTSVPMTPGLIQVHNINSQPATGPGGVPATVAPEKETYTLSDRTSTLVQTTGQIPPPLIGSTSVIHQNRMYLFGGRPPGKKPTNDLYVLHLDTLKWTLVDQQAKEGKNDKENGVPGDYGMEDVIGGDEKASSLSSSSPLTSTSITSQDRMHPLSQELVLSSSSSSETNMMNAQGTKRDKVVDLIKPY
ncbi:hypothetical protein EDD11_000511 [Mortierella claussenii]|nr:hypothetical protein EDD11_000511 [Mortierella claussenii]